MHFDETFWVGASFLIFMGIFVKLFGRLVLNLLDGRAEKIKDELDEALKLKEEAQALLASYERKHREIEKEAAEIVTHAEEESKLIAEQSEKSLDESLNRRVEMAMQKIASYETSILQELRGNAVDVILNSVQELIAKNMDKATAQTLITQAIDDAGKKL